MPVLCIALLFNAEIIAIEYELSNISYFLRGSAQEAFRFLAKTVVERTPAGNRAKIEQDANVAHVYIQQNTLACVLIADASYPTRSAHAVITKLLNDFESSVPRSSYSSGGQISYPQLKQLLVQVQNPANADPFLRVQRELDETKIVLHKTMESLLQRGEKLDDLVARSDQLSSQSKMFYKTAKQTNTCCYY
ncbi:palmitoyltransferase [Nowakowskiella sp. JEL0407]|nr:palmitoyltransferase [Nowakowskiella sp. JEL0407]